MNQRASNVLERDGPKQMETNFGPVFSQKQECDDKNDDKVRTK
jgi:hypothetical protein